MANVDPCMYCGGNVIRTMTVTPSQLHDPVSRQAGSHVKIITWECSRDVRHNGEWVESYDLAEITRAYMRLEGR